MIYDCKFLKCSAVRSGVANLRAGPQTLDIKQTTLDTQTRKPQLPKR